MIEFTTKDLNGIRQIDFKGRVENYVLKNDMYACDNNDYTNIYNGGK